MYSIIKIGGEEYKLEYSFEASMYSDCVSSVMKIIGGLSNETDIHEQIAGMSDIPKVAVTLLYAGLLEHHGIEGDNKVMNLRTAKMLAKQWILEQGEDGNFYELLTLCTNQMGEDGFFKLIGLEEILSPEAEEKKPVPKKPQDHQKKARKTTEK